MDGVEEREPESVKLMADVRNVVQEENRIFQAYLIVVQRRRELQERLARILAEESR